MHLLILDLDETLIYADKSPLERSHDFRAGDYYVYKRPYLDDFISNCFLNFTVAVWTTSTDIYAKEIVGNIFPDTGKLAFVWDRNRCIRRYDSENGEYYWIKDLKKIKKYGFTLDQILMIDDTPRKIERNYGNIVRISEWIGNTEDKELPCLSKYLQTLKDSDQIRKIEKRNWYNQIKITEQID